jgi:hypothetical protein
MRSPIRSGEPWAQWFIEVDQRLPPLEDHPTLREPGKPGPQQRRSLHRPRKDAPAAPDEGRLAEILGEIHKGTRNAVVATEEGSRRARETAVLAGDTGRTIQGLADAIRESAVAARQIAGNTRQQTVGVEQIVQAITELSTAMNDTVAGTRQIERVASNLNTLAGRLATIVGRYRA